MTEEDIKKNNDNDVGEEVLEVKPIVEGKVDKKASDEEGKEDTPKKEKSKKAKKGKHEKNEKPFIAEVADEVKRVTWPTKPEIAKWSVIVIAAVTFFTAFTMVSDNFLVMPAMYFISGLRESGAFDIIAIALTVTMFLSGILLLITIMMHSGVDGGGLSDATATSIAGGANSLAVVERNLNRITVALAIIFVLSILGLMLFFPQGTINPR